MFIGSKADIPKNLLEQAKILEEQFTVPTEKLKSITDHFVSELAKGKWLHILFMAPSSDISVRFNR
jgi:hexokinase